MVEVRNLEEAIQQLLEEEDTRQFRKHYLQMHPYDQASFFKEQPGENRLRIYSYLSPKEMSFIMENVEIDEAKDYITEMDPRFASMVFAEMSADDAVDILQKLSKDEVASFLTIMEKEPAEEIKELLHYEEKTAGSIMTTEYVSYMQTETVKDVLEKMKIEAPEAKTIYYTNEIDEDKKLVGVLSL